MIQKTTILNISDTCGYIKNKCFHTYSKTYILSNYNFTNSSIRKTLSKFSKSIGKKKKTFVIRKICINKQLDGTNYIFFSNDNVIIKKRLSILGKYVKGPILFNIKRKKLLSSFSHVLLC